MAIPCERGSLPLRLHREPPTRMLDAALTSLGCLLMTPSCHWKPQADLQFSCFQPISFSEEISSVPAHPLYKFRCFHMHF